jgi:hypothetical protein
MSSSRAKRAEANAAGSQAEACSGENWDHRSPPAEAGGKEEPAEARLKEWRFQKPWKMSELQTAKQEAAGTDEAGGNDIPAPLEARAVVPESGSAQSLPACSRRPSHD